MQPGDSEDNAALPSRPRFPGWVLPVPPRPAQEDSPWAETDPDLLRAVLEGLEDL